MALTCTDNYQRRSEPQFTEYVFTISQKNREFPANSNMIGLNG